MDLYINPPGRDCAAARRDSLHLHLLALAVGVALAGAGKPAMAHDSWFERLSPAGASGPLLLALGTGNLYPERETGVGPEYLRQQGCRGAATAASAGGSAAASAVPGGSAGAPSDPSDNAALVPVRNAKAALLLRAPAGVRGCWTQLTPFDIELPADKVAPYLDEMNASVALRSTWASMQARGLRWQERYTKHARIELSPGGAEAPAPMGMDALLLRRDGQLVFTVLRDGQPVPGLAVELRSAAPATGSWHRTDERGQIQLPEPAAGRWLLRAIDLRPSDTRPDQWESRFLTLAFDGSLPAAGRAAQQPFPGLQR